MAAVEVRSLSYCYPDGTIDTSGTSYWNAADFYSYNYGTGVDDAGYLRALIGEIGSQFSVDRKRIHLIGHSNGDMLSHAITDALLGACGLGNIGEMFPDTDNRYKGVSSLKFLRSTADFIRKKGYEIGNIDSNILAQRPKLLPYFPQMQTKIAEVLGIPANNVHVKAKTMEHLGVVGTEEAIAAEAVALVFLE